MKAILLTAGEGSRLDPFTPLRPKSVLPLANRPLIRYLVWFLKEAGIREIGVVVGYKGEMVREVVDGMGDGEVQVSYFVQDPLEGPVGALRAARAFVEGPMLVMCADSFFPPAMVKEVIARHEAGETACTLACGPTERPLYHFKAEADERGMLRGMVRVEAKQQFRSEDIVCGLAVFEPEVFERIGCYDRPGSEWEGLMLQLAEEGAVGLCRSEREFVDMDYPWEIGPANGLAIRHRFERRGPYISDKVCIHESVVLEGTNVIEDDVVIEPWCFIRNSWIGKGSKVLAHSYLQSAFFGEGCEIGPQCFVNGGTAGEGSHIGYNTSYKAVGLGRVGFWHECHIIGVWDDGSGASGNCMCTGSRADGATIRMKIKGELVDSGLLNLNPMIGQGVELQAGAKVMPGRKMGHHSVAGPGMIVYHDVPPHTLLIARPEVEVRQIPNS